MTYRDDRDALLARADALEREADRLREENERLRLEAPVTYPTSPLALSLSLQSNGFDRLMIVPMIAGCVAIAYGLGRTSNGLQIALCILAILAFVAACMGISVMQRTRQLRREDAWIDAAPLGLDPAAYRRLLSEHHASRAVIVRIALDAATEDARAAIVAAVSGRWDDQTYVVISPTFVTVRARRDEAFHDNAAVHRWVRWLVDETLAPLASHVPIRSVSIANA